MAYPEVSGPYGLKPINLIGGQVFAGATRQFPIASGYATAMFCGDDVQLVEGNVIAQPLETTDIGEEEYYRTVGVFLGCSYTDPVLKYKVFSQFYPGNITAPDIMAVVADDPDTLFQAVVMDGTDVGGVALAAVGQNIEFTKAAGNQNTGNSKNGVKDNPTTDVGRPLRIIAVVPESVRDYNGEILFNEVIVKWNEPFPYATAVTTEDDGDYTTTVTTAVYGGHQYRNPTGVES
jgi:hypothetical protein